MKVRHPSYITITIPAFKEVNILHTLQSLLLCDRDGITLSINILINQSVHDLDEITAVNKTALSELTQFIQDEYLESIVQLDYQLFDSKHAGVGLARKTLMDRVANEYKASKINGIIVALDADCTVKPNYLQEIKRFFSSKNFDAASLYFEHPLLNTVEYKPIIEYEFHLRYFIFMQKQLSLPFAIHTVGSSMACLSDVYLAKGGMNKRKAGEDFYFMHKFIQDGVCGILTETTVYPDGRISDRVPFGTGRAVGKYTEENYRATTYNPAAFIALTELIHQVPSLYEKNVEKENIDEMLLEFLESIDIDNKLNSIRKNTSSLRAFTKRFYQFFDAFQLMKCLHFIRPKFEDITMEKAAFYLCKEVFNCNYTSVYDTLMILREIDAGKKIFAPMIS